MEKILFLLFIVLIITTPFLYRIIRLGNISWFVKKDQLDHSPNYDKAENLRFIQIILGLCYFIFHGLTLWGWTNIVLFMFIVFVKNKMPVGNFFFPKNIFCCFTLSINDKF